MVSISFIFTLQYETKVLKPLENAHKAVICLDLHALLDFL
jgi:hypothetical protein